MVSASATQSGQMGQRSTFSAPVAIVITAVLFASIHFFALTGGASARLVTIGLLFFPSLVFGTVYEYTGNLVVSALLHGIHNSILLLGIYVTATGAAGTGTIVGGLPV